MNLIFDNLTATVIGGFVLFIVIFMQQRVRDVAVEETMMYAANRHAIELGTWMQEDMVNIGWEAIGSNGIVAIQANDSIPDLTKWFEYDGYDASNDTAATRIQYQLVPALSDGKQNYKEVNGTGVPLWVVQRVVGGKITGESAPLVTHFRIQTLDMAGAEVAKEFAEQIRVRFSMALPYSDDSFISEVHWGTVLPISN